MDKLDNILAKDQMALFVLDIFWYRGDWDKCG